MQLVRLVTILVLAGCLSIAHAETQFTPSLSISEEYTDNVYSSHIDKRDEFITRVRPGFSLLYTAPYWDWKINYQYDFRYFAKLGDSETSNHNLDGSGLIKVIDDLLFISISDRYERKSLDVSRDTTQEGYFVNQSDVNTLTVSPYFTLNSQGKTPVTVGYTYSNIWYKDSRAIDKEIHSAFTVARYHLTPRLDMTADYVFSRQTSDSDTVNQHKVLAGFEYEYSENSKVYAQGGYGWFESDANSQSTPFWKAGVVHSVDRYEFTASTEVSYSEDPLKSSNLTRSYAAAIKRSGPSNTTSFGGSVKESIQTETNKPYSKTYLLNAATEQQLHPSISVTASASYEYFDIRYADTYTERIIGRCGMAYFMNYGITARLSYEYLTMYSPGIPVDNKDSNRIILELSKTF